MKVDKRFLDPNWRLENLYQIVDKAGNKSKFKPNKIQRLLNQETAKRKIILKARQVGITTNELLKMADYVFFNKHKTAVILAHENDAIEKLFRIPRRAYDYLHPELQPEIYKGGGSRFAMFFPKNNSRIYCDLESRGDSIHWLHISERAFIEDRNRVLATIECVPMDGIITMESTPNGMNDFYDLWMQKDSNYKNLFYPWYFQDEYRIDNHEITKKDLDEGELNLISFAKSKYGLDLTLEQIAFRRYKQRELKNMFKQEYPEDDASCFLSSGENPFRLDLLKTRYDNAPKPIEVINGIRIYEKIKQKEIYVIGADTAEGVGGDYSAAHVFTVKDRRQVASFHGQLKPSEFAEKLEEMSALYSKNEPILIGVERNNHGHAVLLKLDEILNYPNLYKTNDKLGWVTDKITRPLMIDQFIEAFENGTITLNDRDTLDECLTLTNDNGKIRAFESKHDDLFISACISVQMCIEESYMDIYSNIENKIKI